MTCEGCSGAVNRVLGRVSGKEIFVVIILVEVCILICFMYWQPVCLLHAVVSTRVSVPLLSI